MRFSEAQIALEDLSRLNRAARRPRADVWFPLLVFGLINLFGVALAWMVGREHLGKYYLPLNLLGGLACARHYWRAGRTTGLQAPTLMWLAVILGATVLSAACSVIGRKQHWELVNLAGPALSMMVGFLVLSIWARSSTLLWVAGGIATSCWVVLAFAEGDTAIALQLAGFSATMLLLATMNYRQRRPT
jgi:hypothetical protein